MLVTGTPPIVLTSELDASVHEFTNAAEHGTSASSSPSGTLWAVDRLSDVIPRIVPLHVPLPDGVTTLHTHGLAMLGDTLFAVNHAFSGGGERIERWRVTRIDDGGDGPPVRLTHLGALLGHDGDATGAGAWTFTSRMNGAINAVAPVGGSEVFISQFVDTATSMEGAGSGFLESHHVSTEEPFDAHVREASQALGVEVGPDPKRDPNPGPHSNGKSRRS